MQNYRKARFLSKELKVLNRNELDYIENLTRSLLHIQNSVENFNGFGTPPSLAALRGNKTTLLGKICFTLLSFTVFALAGLFCLTACENSVNNYEWAKSDVFRIDDYVKITKETGADFHILQLADIHLSGNSDNDKRAFTIIRNAIIDTNPDLLVLSGDNIFSLEHNYATAALLIAFLDTLNLPYAIVLGNHDGQGVFNDAKIGDIYSSGRHSLFTKGPENIPGCGNYGINLVNKAGEVIYAFVFIDSNRYRNLTDYDCIYPQQIAWYEWYIRGIKPFSKDPDRVRSLVFFHIPLPEINDVRTELKDIDPTAEHIAFRETPCPPRINTGMFQKMQYMQSTTHIFNGHDHSNMLDYEYHGIHFVYGIKTGPCGSHDEDRVGTTLITIKDDLTVTVDFIQARE